jgi:hypothetical protein
LKRPRDHHVHYVLAQNDVLPIVQATAQPDSGSAPIKEERTGTSQSSSYGGFSEVQKVKFNDSHFEFGSDCVSQVFSSADSVASR